MRFPKRKAMVAVAGASVLGVVVAAPAYWFMGLPPYAVPEMILRSGRTALAGALITADYKGLPDETAKDYQEKRRAVHQRTAERMLAVCRANAGVYTKAGQHIASLVFLVPKEYTETLGVLTDKAPFMPMSEVDQVMTNQLGRDWRLHFAEFEEEPIAAASLAQVHRGVLTDGRKVAVKVQFPAVTRQMPMDVVALTICARVIGYFFPKFEFTWVMPEFKYFISREIDFEFEADNNERIKAQFAGQKQIAMPDVYRELSGKRVLVMEWIEGCKMNDVAAIRKMGFHEHTVAKILLQCFADQVFVNGFLHSDPHSANAFVRPVIVRGREVPQLVLLDHGLYRELDQSFRYNYAHLVRAMLLKDKKEAEVYARALGAGDDFRLFEMLIEFLARSSKLAEEKISPAERDRLRREWADADERVSKMLKNLDRQVLLVLRTSTILRGINLELGGGVSNYFIQARAAVRSLHDKGLMGWLATEYELLKIRLSIVLLRIKLWWRSLGHKSVEAPVQLVMSKT